MREDIINHAAKKTEEMSYVLVRSKLICDAMREEYGDRSESLIADMRKGKPPEPEVAWFIDETLWNEAPVVELYEAEGNCGPYPIMIQGVKGAYFAWQTEDDPVGLFTNLRDARRYVLSNWGACDGFRFAKRRRSSKSS